MKTFTKIILVTLISFLSYTSVTAQGQIYDVASIGQGYANQSFYSMVNGEISVVSNTDWDLAFQIAGFQASILVNSKNNVRLFRAGLDVNSWSNITANDTVGKLNSTYELLNQDTSWWSGAFNVTADPSNQFDLGWGVYDFATHAVTGDSLFFIKLSNGVVKKLWIQQLANGIYNFAHADVDGSNEVNASLNKTAYPGKNFGYYSINNNITIDREPNKYLWDLTFVQYMAISPLTYKVTGVLANDSVQTAKAYPVDVTTVDPWNQNYRYQINNIGYSWKAFDLNNNQWNIADSLVYFVYDRPGNLWKLIFTGFGGASTGNYEFIKEQISSTGVEENGGMPALLSVYPNPANDIVKMTLFVESYNSANEADIFDVNGRRVLSIDLGTAAGLQEITVNTSDLNSGIYMIRTVVDGISSTQRLVIVK